jgi:hypothetical protein
MREASATAAAADLTGGAILGTNLGEVSLNATEWPFVDAFRTALAWIPQREGAPWGQGGPLRLTPQGWVASLDPGQAANAIMFNADMPYPKYPTPHYPAGRYTLLYDGEGTLAFEVDGAVVRDAAPGRMTVDVTPRPSGIWLRLSATNPANPVRNIRFVLPGFEGTYATQPFHPLFLQRMAPYRAIRFLNWQRIDTAPPASWTNRTTPDSHTQAAEEGVAVEWMVRLANILHTDAWFSMPHDASDDYARQFAALVRDQLDPSLKAYLEYSNETWNPTFPQCAYARQRGTELGLAPDAETAGLRYHAQRATEIFALWEQVFGGRTRLVRVLAAHAARPETGTEVMDWRGAAQHADALAIAPYFGGPALTDPANLAQTIRLSVDQVLDAALADIRDTQVGIRWQITQNRANSRARGLPMISYEGGQTLVGEGAAQQSDELNALFIAANRHPRMRQLYAEYLAQWRALGGGLFMHLQSVGRFTQHGSWGALEYQDQDIATAPKYQALLDFAGRRSTFLPLVTRTGG